MKKTKNYKYAIIAISSLLVIFSFLNLIRMFVSFSGVLVNSSELNSIKSTVASYVKDFNSFKIYSLEGNKRYLSITFASADYSQGYQTVSMIYDTKKNKVIKSVEIDENVIDLLNCSFIKYVGDNTFLVLDSFGKLYNLNTETKDFKAKLIMETGINKENLFKYFYKDKSLYIISRETLSKYNERTLSGNNILELKFKNKKFKKADTVTYKFNDSDFIYNFVLDGSGNIGVVGSSSKDVLGETVNALLLPSDETYLKQTPSFNKSYKFIDTSTIWVRFLHDDSIVNIKEDDLNLEYRPIHSLVNKKLDINISSPSNIPMYITDDFILYSGFKYEDMLNSASFYPTTDVTKVYRASGVEKESVSSIRSNMYWLNYKTNKYIAFFPTSDGISGIKKNGSLETVLKSTVGFIYNKTAIFLEDNNIKFKRI